MGIQKIFAGLTLAAATAFQGAPAMAQTTPPAQPRPPISADTIKKIKTPHLAYVRVSGGRDMDSRLGLEALAYRLLEKTSAYVNAAGVDIEKDDLSVYSFIYWPVSAATPVLSEQAQRKVQNYINTGGVILFDRETMAPDTRDITRILGRVTTRPLVRLDKDHTLMKSFYLVSGLPGSTGHGTIWVESPGTRGQNYVSSIIVGSNNWASAWAGRSLAPESREREMALRSGVNMVMFALMGNYPDDQIHLPFVLERLAK